MSETKIEQAIIGLDFAIRNLRASLDRASESSTSFQKKVSFLDNSNGRSNYNPNFSTDCNYFF